MAAGIFDRLKARLLSAGPTAAPDVDRWKSLENNEDWNDRARLVAPYVSGFLPVLDIGSGTRYLHDLVGSANYRSVDSVADHGADWVRDLNVDPIPADALQQSGSVTFLGVLEYLVDPESHLRNALADGRRVVFTYTPVDLVADLAVRRENGWMSHLSFADIGAMLERLGAEPVDAVRFNETQAIYVLGGSDPKLEVEPAIESPAVKPKRSKLVVSGFFARGNAGDEALLQRIYETFSPHTELVCTIDRTGAYEGFWDWYPYNQMELIHQGELARMLADDVVGLHIGGGGLPIGFNAAQAAVCRSVGKPVVSTGVDDPLRMLLGHAVAEPVVRDYVGEFAEFSVRTQESVDALQSIGAQAQLGADWAFDLPVEAADGDAFDGVIVVIRELPKVALDRQRASEYRKVFQALRHRGIEVRLLPFCPEDERYLQWLEPSWGHVVERHWWNPRRCKGLIAQARGLISIGRLHPLIFAASAGVPTVAIDIDTKRFTSVGATSKIKDHAEEFDIPYFPDMSSFLAAIGRDGEIPMSSAAPEPYVQRLDGMRSSVLKRFGL